MLRKARQRAVLQKHGSLCTGSGQLRLECYVESTTNSLRTHENAMAGHYIGKRLYSDREVGRLIQRATELQREDSESDEHGLTFEEIEHVASEIGIESEHLRRAVAEMEQRPDSDRRISFWGTPFVLAQERVVEGTLAEEQWERIVPELRRLTGSTGTVAQIGQTREWTRTIKDMDYVVEQTQVSIMSKDRRTTISVRKQYRGGARMAYVLSVLLGGTVAGIFLDGAGLSDLLNTTILGSGGISGLIAARTSIAYWTKRQRKRVKELTDWLQVAVARPDILVHSAQSVLETRELSPDQDSQYEPHLKQRLRT